MSTWKGIKMFGDRAVMAILKEFSQLNNTKVVVPLDHDSLTKQQMINTLRTISPLSE